MLPITDRAATDLTCPYQLLPSQSCGYSIEITLQGASRMAHTYQGREHPQLLHVAQYSQLGELFSHPPRRFSAVELPPETQCLRHSGRRYPTPATLSAVHMLVCPNRNRHTFLPERQPRPLHSRS